MSTRRDVTILGSTGSIGTRAIDVIRANPDRFRVVGLAAAGSHVEVLAAQAYEFAVPTVAIALPAAVRDFQLAYEGHAARRQAERPPYPPTILVGTDSAADLATLPCYSVLNAVPGFAGLRPTLATLDAGHVLLLANKESLVAAGLLVKAKARPQQIVPIDSEHSAISQCLAARGRSEVRRLILTASGGPFRGRTRAELADVTVEQALAHPTWQMGPLISVNSATLVNKGLEVIEAHLLFGVEYDRIDVVVHPQSVIHSMVEFSDGATIAQLSPPDSRLPLSVGLGWPDRVPDAVPPCDWSHALALEFQPLDNDAFPAVDLARLVGRLGGVVPAVYNAANEEGVRAFLAGDASFDSIVTLIARAVDAFLPTWGASVANRHPSLADVIEADEWARKHVRRLIRRARARRSPTSRPRRGSPRRRSTSEPTTISTQDSSR